MNVRDLRQKTGLSQSKFAKLYDIPVKTLQQWEQGSHNPPGYVLILLNKALEADGYFDMLKNNYFKNIIKNNDLSENFYMFRSNIQHMIKKDSYGFILSIIETDIIFFFYNNKDYIKCMYLISCLDTLCLQNKIPFCSDYDDLRKIRLKSPLVLCRDKNKALPEFVRHNIYERSLTDVF